MPSTMRSTLLAMPSRTPAKRSRTLLSKQLTQSDKEGRPGDRAALFYIRPKWHFGRDDETSSLAPSARRLRSRGESSAANAGGIRTIERSGGHAERSGEKRRR